MKNKNIIILVSAILLAGVAGFLGGSKYQQSKLAKNFPGWRNTGNFQRDSRQAGNQLGNKNRNGFQPTAGKIMAIDDKSMTVKLNNGSNKIILLSDSMSINKSASAAKSDLKIGEKVSVFGTTNADGSMTAQSIQINPAMPNAGNVPN